MIKNFKENIENQHFTLLPLAELEVFDAIRYLDEQSPEAAYRLSIAIRESFLYIAQNPLASVTYRKKLRRYPMNAKHFQYTIYYQVNENQIVIVAFLHQKRSRRGLLKRIS